MNSKFWLKKKVFITGHTGFKGSWLALWLQHLGAEVHGYALNPPTTPNLYSVANVNNGMASSKIADIRDAVELIKAIQEVQPDIVLHLAAQPLVRYSYDNPVETYAVNVMGTVNLFEAIRQTPCIKAVVNVTTDKCYENQEWVWPYRESEPMGGYDPYSSSKACSELVTAAYRCSYFDKSGVAIASARAGNVIGGGDWAEDRLIPDFLRAIDAGKTLVIRSPNAVRPWQHVLEPLLGYLTLAEQLFKSGSEYAEAWNFGPSDEGVRSVEWIVNYLIKEIPNSSWTLDQNPQLHEASQLRLDSSKAHKQLDWQPRWDLESALQQILEWHANWKKGEDMHACTVAQIIKYQQLIIG